MSTKPRTKKPAAKPKRYVRVAVKAGKATLQESDQPNRGFKPQRQPKPTAEDIGRSIGDALGRRLESLLAKPERSGVLHFAEERGGLDDLVRASELSPQKCIQGYSQGCAEQATSVRQSALNNAIDRLRAAISAAEVLTDNTHGRLQDVLSPPVPTAGGTGISPPSNDSPLTCVINDFADRIYADSRRRNDILERLEL